MVDPPEIQIFDRLRLRNYRHKRADTFSSYDFLHRWAADQLGDRLQDIRRDYEHALFMGRCDLESEKISNSYFMGTGAALPGRASVIADEELLPFANASLDLIISNFVLHSTNDLPGVLIQIRRALKPDGVFLAAMPGGETLYELRESLMQAELETKGGASPRVFPFADKQQMGALMQRAGYALPVVDSEIITVTYRDMFALMHDLRGMGESNIIAKRSRNYPGRDYFARAADYYTKTFSEPDGKIRASFEIIFLTGWAPHDSQQKPLKPGSAASRLADALGTAEISTGQKTGG